MEILIYSIICVTLLVGSFLYYGYWKDKKEKENEKQKRIEQYVRGGEGMYRTSSMSVSYNRPTNPQSKTKIESSQSVSPDDGFLTSMLVAQATDSALIGMVVGGNPIGAMIGDSLNDSDDNTTTKNHHLFDDYSSHNHSDYSSSDSSDYNSSHDSGSSYDSSDSSSYDSSSSSDW